MKKCYICRKELTISHEKYSRLCKECGEYNLLERERIENLQGYIAIVTGGRIKIGYYTFLKLLKAGAKEKKSYILNMKKKVNIKIILNL